MLHVDIRFIEMNWKFIKDRLSDLIRDNHDFIAKTKNINLKRASVLILLLELDGKLHVLLTKRSEKLSSHTGDVCFPGGKENEGESVIETALRETEEEIGLGKKHIEVLGCMMPFLSYSNILVTPVLGAILNINEVKLNVNCHEVDDVFICPLDLFITNHAHSFINARGAKLHSFSWSVELTPPSVRLLNPFFQSMFSNIKHQSFLIYGLTAQIALLASVLCLNQAAVLDEITFSAHDLVKRQKDHLSERLFAEFTSHHKL